MSPKKMMINKLESDILANKKFSTKYKLSTLIYSNRNVFLYGIINKSTNKKYFLEVVKSSRNYSEDYIDQWETNDFCYIIKE